MKTKSALNQKPLALLCGIIILPFLKNPLKILRPLTPLIHRPINCHQALPKHTNKGPPNKKGVGF